MTEDRIVKSVPRTYQARVKKLIEHLKDYMSISWNADCEMIVHGQTLPGSNISVLVNDIIRNAKHEVDPVGRKFLVEQLSKTKLPRGRVGYAEISRELRQSKHKSITPRKSPSNVSWID